jgi:hypothetical protein
LSLPDPFLCPPFDRVHWPAHASTRYNRLTRTSSISSATVCSPSLATRSTQIQIRKCGLTMNAWASRRSVSFRSGPTAVGGCLEWCKGMMDRNDRGAPSCTLLALVLGVLLAGCAMEPPPAPSGPSWVWVFPHGRSDQQFAAGKLDCAGRSWSPPLTGPNDGELRNFSAPY